MTTEERRETAFESVRRELAAWDGKQGRLYWLSFVDPARPKGERFLGGCIVRSPSLAAATAVAHRQGCNPGGEVATLPFPVKTEGLIADKWINRVLSREEASEFDKEIAVLRSKTAGSN